MKNLVNQPLLHFLVLGIALFLVFEYNPDHPADSLDNKTITIDREALITFMQYRSRAFNEDYFSQELASMPQEEIQRMVKELAREEVLYREALALQLDEYDYVIKQRLVQKMEYLTRGFITAGTALSEADIGSYYEEHKHEYYVSPYVTFTHVFFDYTLHDREQARLLAEAALRELNGKQVPFSRGIEYGDRFLYYVNYVERSHDYVASHFGVETADALFRLAPDPSRWRGPFASEYGLHLVLLTKNEPGRFPGIGEIHDRVKDDAEQARIRENTEAAIDELISDYEIEITLGRGE